jgi:hypothetical protein
MRQHTSAYVSIGFVKLDAQLYSRYFVQLLACALAEHTSAYVSIREHTSA